MPTKNIVLLSDGTGNSAAKPFKTNVWRFYQAIDINPPKTDDEPMQVVFYDDGVGTENFKPLAYLGLALGLGLQHNVKKLYTFLCRNYSKGDNIFLLGFSRGAFTVRVLAGMILRCGLVHADNEEELREQVDLVYNAFKWDCVRRAAKTGRAKLFNLFLGGYDRIKDLKYVPLGDKITQRFPKVAFIGVWDTVDAYGMPVDEIKLGIDRFIWPMTLADRDLSPLVERACHALSLDDERPTFRPVLWNEVKKENGEAKPVDDKQLMQIWFAGVHANVGGGYPDDGLAHVAMQWMMDEAQRQGLWFYPGARLDVDCRANAHGKQYDSRSGLAGYYRYGPRKVDELCHDTDHGVEVTVPKVHASAIKRIESWEVAYAPVSFPSNYVVMARSAENPPGAVRQSPPPSDDIAARVKDMQAAWDAVTRRRYAYLATVWLTVVLAVLPLIEWLPGKHRLFSPLITTGGDAVRQLPGLSEWLPIVESWLAIAIGCVPGLIGRWSALWVDWYQQHPLFFLIVALVLAWLFFRKGAQLQHEVFMRADYAWRRIRPSAPSLKLRQSVTNPLVHLLSEFTVTRSFYRILTGRIIPLLLTPVALIGVVIAIFYIPKAVRLAALRRKYKVGRTVAKSGTKSIVPIEREKCPVQPYTDPSSRRGTELGETTPH